MKDYIENRLNKVQKFFSAAGEAHIVLKTEKYLNTAEITLNGKRFHFYAEGASEENLYVAIDRAMDRIESQVKRQIEKIKGHDHRSIPGGGKEAGLREGTEASQETLIRHETFDAKPMTLEEARLQLDISDRGFLVFQNAETNEINVIYKKQSGNYGLIKPSF